MSDPPAPALGAQSAGCVPMTAEQLATLRELAPKIGGLEGARLRLLLGCYDAQAARLAAVLFAVREATITRSGRCAGCLGSLREHMRENRACCYWDLHRVRESLESLEAAGAAGEG